ncbi:MAG: hypothetical protein AC479_04275 [miscellaneous Crenarchaeota group-6 archaeon AD8-1]|nr:MAG: hypothetical protein AC479_04275 [miscellaneous Crenarchaeota group-6 archaeon AD8-1]
MSKLSKLVFAILFSSILILNTGLVLGIEPDEASITISWDSSQLNRGEVGIARITFISNFSQPIQIYYIGINFDWMESDTFQGQDQLPSDLIIILLESTELMEIHKEAYLLAFLGTLRF